ncbi:MAG: hypothetical protein Q9181_006691, partial [Wetmoreana brouardii]
MDDVIAENNQRHFQYLGCSGALTDAIKDKQVPKMQKSQAWSAWWFWSCDGELDKAENDVNWDSYFKGMTDMLRAIESKLTDANSRIYWAGYVIFFDSSTDEYDKVTWAFTRVLGFRQTRFNDLTDLVNQKIQDACKTVDLCVYVDSEPCVDQNRGRYCMPGINEKYYGGIDSPVDGWNRERTVFYEWSITKDDDENGEKTIDQPEKRDESNKRGKSFISLETRSDTPGALNNDTFE